VSLSNPRPFDCALARRSRRGTDARERGKRRGRGRSLSLS
jgi:hypothetical protein